MKTGKKLALFLGIATGAVVTALAMGKSVKKSKGIFTRKETNSPSVNQDDESDINYV